MITQDQIVSFTARARSAGYSDADIQAEIERKKRELMGAATKPEPTMSTQGAIRPEQPSAEVPATFDGGAASSLKFERPSTITGHSIEEHASALEKAKAANDKDAIKDITDAYNREFEYQKSYGTSNKQAEAQQFKQDIVNTAKQLQQVIANKDKYDPKTYKDTINSLASSLTLKKKEAENLGAALSGNELAILSGQVPATRTIGMSAVGFFKKLATGEEPVQRGEVVEDEETMKNKLALLIAGMEGKSVDPSLFQKAAGNKEEKKGEELNINIVENALNEVVGGLRAAPEIAKLLIRMSPPGELARSLSGETTGKADLEAAKTMIGGLIQDLSQTTGISMDESGKVVFDPVGALVHDWNHPLSTIAYMTAFRKIASVGKGAKVPGAAVATAEGAASAAKPSFGPIRGRILTSVVSPVADSVVKSEALVNDVMQITKSPTVRGIAKELEAFVPKTGSNIEAYATKLDSVIGPQPVDDAMGMILDKMSNNSVAQSNPALVKTIERIVKNKLETGELPGGLERGQIGATTLKKMNETRKYLNSSISSKWFENGQPLASAADQLNSLKWEASNALKDMMIEADKAGGYFEKAINLQHSALSTAPVMAQKALASSRVSGWFSAAAKAAQSVTEPLKVGAARFMAGKPTELTRSIVGGKVPEAPPALPAQPGGMGSLRFLSPAAPTMRKPLESQIIDTMLERKGPAQSQRMIRDMRFKQGNPAFRPARNEQERFLRQAAKKKYR